MEDSTDADEAAPFAAAPEEDLTAWARGLGLRRHPEGGWYRETWRSDLTLPAAALPPRYVGGRNAATGILFLLMPGEQSVWHRVESDELWLHHRGPALELQLSPEAPGGADDDWSLPVGGTSVLLGSGVEHGEQPQVVVLAQWWQRARPTGGEASLVGCVVSPGFDFSDLSLRP